MKWLRWSWMLVAVLVLTGCIKLDQTVSLNADGSGILKMRYGMSEQTIAQLKAMEQMGQSMGGEGAEMEADTPFDLEFDEEKVREDFASQGLEGVELRSVASETVDGWRFMDLELTFDDLAALQKTEFFEDSALSLTKDAEGNYVLLQRTGDGDASPAAGPGDEEALSAAMMQQMSAMFAGLRIESTVVVPTEIVETNATEVSGNRASWVYDIDEDPGVLSKLEDLDLRVVFAGDGLELAEFGAR